MNTEIAVQDLIVLMLRQAINEMVKTGEIIGIETELRQRYDEERKKLYRMTINHEKRME